MIESSEHAFLVLYRLKEYTVDPLSYTTSKEFKLSSFSIPLEFKPDNELTADSPKLLT
jgi:hypothetical protein